MAEFMAEMYTWSTARSGFTSGLTMGTGYELAGPLIGHVSDEVPRELAPLWVPEHDLPELIWDLDTHGLARWCAALLDDGHTVVLANNVGSTYIPRGKYLPHNSVVISAGSDDAVFWPAYACSAPAEAIVLNAQHFGWLKRITKLVAGTFKTVTEDPPHRRWASPFEWARPMMGSHAATVEFIEVDLSARFENGKFRRYYDGRQLDPTYVHWGSPRRGGRHRLQMIAPQHYARLSELVSGDRASTEAAVLSAAELTVAAARSALALAEGAFTPWGSGQAIEVLQVAAAAEPQTVTRRRLACDSVSCSSVDLSESLGLPGCIAAEWAQLSDKAFDRVFIGSLDRFEPRFDQQAHDHELAGVARRTVVKQALEAIAFWNADPLPVADIEYAARYAAGRW